MYKKPKSSPKAPAKFSRKGCAICAKKIAIIDYKDISLIHQFVTDRYKIVPKRASSICAKHQRVLSINIKRARNIGLIPYCSN